MKMFQELPNRN